jgi:hypothetical protein
MFLRPAGSILVERVLLAEHASGNDARHIGAVTVNP